MFYSETAVNYHSLTFSFYLGVLYLYPRRLGLGLGLGTRLGPD